MFGPAALLFLLAASASPTATWESPDPEKITKEVNSGKLDATALAELCTHALAAGDSGWVLTIDDALPQDSPLRENAALLCELGAANLRQGNDGPAKLELLHAEELDRANPDIHNNLGVLYRRKGLYLEAESQLRAAIALAPERAEPHYNLAVVLLRTSKVDEAAGELRTSYMADSAYSPARRLGGFLALEKGDNQLAVNLLNEYFGIEVGKNPEFSDDEAAGWLDDAQKNLEALQKGELKIQPSETNSDGSKTKTKVKLKESQNGG